VLDDHLQIGSLFQVKQKPGKRVYLMQQLMGSLAHRLNISISLEGLAAKLKGQGSRRTWWLLGNIEKVSCRPYPVFMNGLSTRAGAAPRSSKFLGSDIETRDLASFDILAFQGIVPILKMLCPPPQSSMRLPPSSYSSQTLLQPSMRGPMPGRTLRLVAYGKVAVAKRWV
jgi:hypothetical protein